MRNYFPIGASDFRRVRELGLHYVDKTRIIKAVLDDVGDDVILLPRPRRFGKTLNLTTLRYFFEKSNEDLSHLFQDLDIWRAGDEYLEHFQRYPVIYLTFKDLRPESLELWEGGVRNALQRLYSAHREVEDAAHDDWERRQVLDILEGQADQATQRDALLLLTTLLHRAHGLPVVVLIDEYDTPVQVAWLKGFGETALSFFRSFLGGGLKDNTHLFKVVITGIMRVAKESIFSDLNNLGVYSVLDAGFSDCFGFMQDELDSLLALTGNTDQRDILRDWYNGYHFGDQVVYNPWSVMNFLRDPWHRPQAHWLNTSSNDLIREQLQHRTFAVEADIRTLLEGQQIEKPINPAVVLSKLGKDIGTLWSLLLFSGYLRAEALPVERGAKPRYGLSIPNREVREIYLETFSAWMSQNLPGEGEGLARLHEALFAGDAARLERLLGHFALHALSYHDSGGREPEKLYQGFVVGLLTSLEATHRVKSNRESGQGRPDLLILPRRAGDPGVVMELKVADEDNSLDAALEEGVRQIEARDYSAELRDSGADPIHAFVVAFDGKVVKVRGVTAG